jgi:hypothetical protein
MADQMYHGTPVTRTEDHSRVNAGEDAAIGAICAIESPPVGKVSYGFYFGLKLWSSASHSRRLIVHCVAWACSAGAMG